MARLFNSWYSSQTCAGQHPQIKSFNPDVVHSTVAPSHSLEEMRSAVPEHCLASFFLLHKHRAVIAGTYVESAA